MLIGHIYLINFFFLPFRLLVLVLVLVPSGCRTSSPCGAFRDPAERNPAQAQSSRMKAAWLILSGTPATGNRRPLGLCACARACAVFILPRRTGTGTSGTPSLFFTPVTSRESHELGLTGCGCGSHRYFL